MERFVEQSDRAKATEWPANCATHLENLSNSDPR
jgi:hypothetical protein